MVSFAMYFMNWDMKIRETMFFSENPLWSGSRPPPPQHPHHITGSLPRLTEQSTTNWGTKTENLN